MTTTRQLTTPFPSSLFKTFFVVGVIGLSMASTAAHATLINFDELTQPNCDEPDVCYPLAVDNQYAAMGAVFSTAALVAGPSTYASSQPNAISDFYGPGLDIWFTGPLPTTVSFYLSAALQDAIYVDASGPTGAVGSFISDGYRGPMYDDTYRDLQLVTFSGAEISQLSFSDFYFRRGDIMIDDLFFARDEIKVIEPSSLSLFMAGGIVLVLRRALMKPSLRTKLFPQILHA